MSLAFILAQPTPENQDAHEVLLAEEMRHSQDIVLVPGLVSL